ncbi:hypothetical protein E2C01_069145 [Portunus trituberculatus]|uniref:Uncharacterized protein n=1 Tax=Portunus trituberculatus TaxID=210409 RepID=A0A5B7HQN9_PORTR|nr:hypothetical protein [Portunus trituberculatus]
MSDQDKGHGTLQRPFSSSSKGKHHEKDPLDGTAMRRNASGKGNSSLPLATCASRSYSPPVAGPSDVNIPAASPPQDAELGCLSSLISGLIKKLDKSASPQVSPGHSSNFSGFQDVSSSEDEAVTAPDSLSQASVSDPLDDLDTFTACQPQGDPVADVVLQKTLEELGDPLSERLASILNLSLRRRPSSDSVKQTCDRIKLPNNVLNLTLSGRK